MSVQLGTVTLCSVYASTFRFTERAVLYFITGHFMMYYTEPVHVAHMSPVCRVAPACPKCSKMLRIALVYCQLQGCQDKRDSTVL